jgi:hypothetical protein
MTAMHTARDVRRLVLAAIGTAVAAVALASCGSSGSVVTSAPTADGWKTIEYHGVQVDIPVGWTRADMEDCEFQFERWTPPDLPACSPDGGVSFYASASFDPAHGPGIRHEDTAKGAVAWAGYVYAGGFAVYAADDDRGLVQRLLRSATASGE